MGIEPFACSTTQTWNWSCILGNGCWRPSNLIHALKFLANSLLIVYDVSINVRLSILRSDHPISRIYICTILYSCWKRNIFRSTILNIFFLQYNDLHIG